MAWRIDRTASLWALGVAGVAAMFGVLAVVSPVLALLGAFAIAFLWIALLDLAAGTCLFVLISASLEVLPGVGNLSFARLAGGVLVLSWLGAAVSRPEQRRQFFTEHPAMSGVLVLFVGWSAMSALWAESSAEAITVTIRYLLNFFLLPIVFAAIRTRRQAMIYAAAFVAGVLLSAFYGVVVAPGDMDAAAEGRVTGAGLDPNYLATLVVGAGVLAGAFMASRRHSPITRLGGMVAALLCLAVLLTTVSRTGLVATGAVLIFGILLSGPGRRAPLAGLGVVCAAAVVLYFAALAPHAATQHVTSLKGGTGRTDLWTIGMRMVKAEPLLGVGAGNFPVASIHYLLEPGAIRRDDFVVDTPKVAHNVFLEVQAELGLPGLLAFVAIVGFCVISAMRAAWAFAAKRDTTMEWLARGVAVGSLGMLVGAMFNSLQYTKPIWLLLALGPALLQIARSQSE